MQERQRLHRRRARERAGFRLKRLALGGDRSGGAPEPLARGAAGAAGHAFAYSRRDFRQGCLHIAEDGDGRRVVLAELPWIDVEMNEFDIRRHRIDVGGKRQREQIAPTEKSTSCWSSTLRTSGASRIMEPETVD